jgi:hypothetical protein
MKFSLKFILQGQAAAWEFSLLQGFSADDPGSITKGFEHGHFHHHNDHNILPVALMVGLLFMLLLKEFLWPMKNMNYLLIF